MPSRIVVALEDRTLADGVTALLRAAGEDTKSFTSTTSALSALRNAATAEVLLIGLSFSAGVSLANLARARRPDIRIAFVGSADLAQYTADLGQFIPLPVSAGRLAGLALSLLQEVS